MVCVCFVVAVVMGGFFAEKYWPYRYRNVKPLLQSVFASKVTISHYRRTYFPHPGFVAKELTLYRNSAPGLPPIGSTKDLIVQGDWIDLLTFRQRVRLVEVVDLHVVIPPVGSRANHEDFPAGSSADFSGPSTTVEELRIHHAVLDIMRKDGSRYTYPIRQAIIRNLRQGQPFSFSVDMQNASPTGHIQAAGSFGPIAPGNFGGTPVSGNFTFSRVNLQEIGDLRGTLSSRGRFSGALSAIEVYATADTPDFAVGRGRPVGLSGSVQCTVSGLNSNIDLHNVEVKTGATVVHAQGAIAGSSKDTNVDLAVDKGRAQDLLHPFLKERAPITGPVWLKAHAHLAPADHGAKFLQRLAVDGRFDVPDQRITNRSNAQKLTEFSQRAQGEKTAKDDKDKGTESAQADVVSLVEGPVTIGDGVARTNRLTFEIPGATANLHGSYDFRDGKVHLLGALRMESDISHAETGFKSLLLKPLIPFFKKKKAGAVVPVAVTGEPHHYQVSQNILHQK
jgi:hypothetical protein